ncbi:MAG: 3-dehydro-L-gulonate 2-dehydrogenase [Thioalkalivibrio sp.]|nr:3-dehydro-L-gulonate 2-dehydrogenase [Thioalkalivibrio sp.]
MIRVPYDHLADEFQRVLRAVGFTADRAGTAARIFANASRDGVHSHGLNRFPVFVGTVQKGHVRADARPERIGGSGAVERWDGNLGPGNLNAWTSMERAIELAQEYGVGLVALGNTNHWMRGGTYGWQAAEAGTVGMCWSNTRPNLPPWGAREPRLGNNPLVVGVPRRGGAHVVLDMAMSQFSYGQLESHRLAGRSLPVAGGYDTAGQLTTDPHEIERSGRPLPIGFWKGSGLSLVLDLLAAVLTGGKAVHEITEEESGLSQVFLAIDPGRVRSGERDDTIVDEVLAYVHDATPVETDGSVHYPGERSLRTRRESMELGVLVEPNLWAAVQRMER